MRLADPLLLLLLLVPVGVALLRARRRPATTLHASGALAFAAGKTWRTRLAWAPTALRLLCLALLAVALARPQAGFGVVRTSTDGVAMMMVLDRSSSMNGAFQSGRDYTTRFAAAQQAFREFVEGDGRGLEGRPNDLIGMIAFARYPETVVPLTRAEDALVALARQTDTADQRAEDGTAIGDALALAAARLRRAEQNLKQREGATGQDEDFEIKSKAIVLLTDGENNVGDMRPVEAAELCAEWGIRVYAVGVAGDRRVIEMNGRRVMVPGPRVDDRELRRVAEITGGFYTPAESEDALRAVYERIDELEKTEIRTREYTNYDERFGPLAVAALALLGLELLLRWSVFRRLP